MKNKLRILLIFVILLCHPGSYLFSDEIKFEAENIETVDKNLIIANKKYSTFIFH